MSAATTNKKQVLLADDEPNLRRVLSAQLERDGYDVFAVEDGDAVLQALDDHHIDVLITDLKMPNMSGMDVLKHVHAKFAQLPVIMITAHGTVDTAVEALKLGAFDYVTKPFDQAEFRSVINKAIATAELAKRSVALAPGARGRFRIIGESDEIRQVYEVIGKVADTPSTVMITGESGTGKELIATALHDNSSRSDKPLVRVNCAAIPPELIESELFGYEKGAFTGAVTSKPGRFELADGGTLFLDEIGDVPPAMQVKLLRVLQEQAFERVGGIKTNKVDVRLVTATNKDLRAELAAGRFRDDLYYRLNVVHIDLPPLRARPSDIPLLIEHFVSVFNKRLSKDVRGFAPEGLQAMLTYGWPGNIRELENVVERCMIFTDANEIALEHLPPEVRGEAAAIEAGEPTAQIPDTGLKQAVREATAKIERRLIERALDQTEGNVTHAARLLKISRKSLQNKMKDLGLRGGN